MGRVLLRVNRSPFYRRGRDTSGKWIGIPSRIESSEVRAKVSREQAMMIWDANYYVVRPLRSWLLNFVRNGKLSREQYNRITRFARMFMYTPRVENGKEIYRGPTDAELIQIFPALRIALQHPRKSGKKRRKDEDRFPKY